MKLVINSELQTDCIRIAIKHSISIMIALNKVFQMKVRHKSTPQQSVLKLCLSSIKQTLIFRNFSKSVVGPSSKKEKKQTASFLIIILNGPENFILSHSGTLFLTALSMHLGHLLSPKFLLSTIYYNFLSTYKSN